MTSRILYLILFILLLVSCNKLQIEFDINSKNKKSHIELFTNKTFKLYSENKNHSGNWEGNTNDGDTITIISTNLNGKIITLTQSKKFIVRNNQLSEIKNGKEKGWFLDEFIDFNKITRIRIQNIKGAHYVNNKQKEEIINELKMAKSIGGLICKPQQLGLFFELQNGKKFEGTICGSLINFETGFSGSFEIENEINFHNY